MVVKTITISLEAYEALAREKLPGESFSDVILRLVKRSGSLLDLAGSWKMDDSDAEKLMEELRELWRKWSARY